MLGFVRVDVHPAYRVFHKVHLGAAVAGMRRVTAVVSSMIVVETITMRVVRRVAGITITGMRRTIVVMVPAMAIGVFGDTVCCLGGKILPRIRHEAFAATG